MADSLARKVALMARDCAYVQKTGTNNFHRYTYATAADVFEKVNAAMVEHGVCATVDAEVLSETVDAGNRTVTVKTVLTLHDADSDQTLTTAGLGCGQDKGDKAVMKALTASLKYSWMLCLNISTGDDPEADEETDKRAAAPPKQQAAPRPPAAPNGAHVETPAAVEARHLDQSAITGANPIPPAETMAILWQDAKKAVDYLRSIGVTDVGLPAQNATSRELDEFLTDARRRVKDERVKASRA